MSFVRLAIVVVVVVVVAAVVVVVVVVVAVAVVVVAAAAAAAAAGGTEYVEPCNLVNELVATDWLVGTDTLCTHSNMITTFLT